MMETKVSKMAKIMIIVVIILLVIGRDPPFLKDIKDLILDNLLLVMIISIIFLTWRTR